MQTFVIKNEKDLEKYKDDYGYHIEGHAEFEYSAEFTGRLLVDGYLYIEAGGYIEAGEYIEAGGYIKAGESSGIVAGLYITCKTTLSFGLRAFAGTCSWREISDEDKTITCGKLEKGTIEYGILKETGLEEEKINSKKVTIKLDDGQTVTGTIIES